MRTNNYENIYCKVMVDNLLNASMLALLLQNIFFVISTDQEYPLWAITTSKIAHTLRII
jgi:hypothetical protein